MFKQKSHQMRLFNSSFKLLTNYYLKGFLPVFYLVFFPFILLMIQSVVLYLPSASPVSIAPAEKAKKILEAIQYSISGVFMMQMIVVGINLIPSTIIEFRNSIIIKHFGSMNMKPKTFFWAVIAFGVILSVVTIIITLLWSLLIFGRKKEVGSISNLFSFINGATVGYLLLLILISISFGVMLSTFIKTVKTHNLLSTIIFVPILLLSGGFLKITVIEKNFVLNIISYFTIFRFPGALLTNTSATTTMFAINLSISLILPIIFIGISIRWWKWYD